MGYGALSSQGTQSLTLIPSFIHLTSCCVPHIDTQQVLSCVPHTLPRDLSDLH